MLILTRKPGESLFIGDKIKVVVVEIKGNQIRLGIEAPSDVRILREEIYAQILEENKSAAEPVSGDSLDGLSAVLGPASHSSGDSDDAAKGKKPSSIAASSTAGGFGTHVLRGVKTSSNHGGKKK